ncbi:hypothetical protein [Mycobacterium sp. URHB0044]|uniref:hypothetical protein n=1 Tax=Mycobacterium sp. URHB0044 TaxID=1380386 RepID=UPI000490D869|nr:hypothetical protein [Mycobacterium sp. URHB0044]
MIKKALVAAIAAGALSVPLAALASADPPSDPGSTANGIGSGGVPAKLGNFLDTGITPGANPSGAPVTPGSVINGLAKLPGTTPDAMGQFETGLWATHTLTNGDQVQTVWGPTPPGLAVKPITPGCSHGHTAVTDSTSVKCVG